MARPWEADPTAEMKRRIGRSALELGETNLNQGCPDIWELDNGDVAVIGRDLTTAYAARLPHDVTINTDEKLVVIPRSMLIAARTDIPVLERIRELPGQVLTLDAYSTDFKDNPLYSG